ncbi:uncharacterized protein [Apostichopus japonicus]
MRKGGRFLQILLVSLLQTLLRNSKISVSGSEVTSSISKEPVKTNCVLNGCPLLTNIAVLKSRGILLLCSLTTKDLSIQGNKLQIVLLDTDTEFVLGENNCQWRTTHNAEYSYCNLHVQQNFTEAMERHLVYFTTPGNIYERFTVNVINGNDAMPDEMELCEEGIRYPTTIKPEGLVSISSIHLYQNVKSSNHGPSLLGKLAVTTISVLVVLFCVLGIRWYYKSKTDEEIRPKNGEDEHMIVYKTQPTWCNDPDTDSDVNELEPFYCHDSDR